MFKRIIKWLFTPNCSYMPSKERNKYSSIQIYDNKEGNCLSGLISYYNKNQTTNIKYGYYESLSALIRYIDKK